MGAATITAGAGAELRLTSGAIRAATGTTVAQARLVTLPGSTLAVEGSGSAAILHQVWSMTVQLGGDTVIASTATLRMDGNLELLPAGSLQVAVAGPTAGNGHGVLRATGTITLAGDLQVVTDAAFTPADDTSLTVIDAVTLVGDFATRSAVTFADGTRRWNVLVDDPPGDVRLVATTGSGGTPPSTTGDELVAGITDWFGGLKGIGDWNFAFGSGFDLGTVDWPSLGLRPVTVPVLPADLRSLFDLDDVFSGVVDPVVEAGDEALSEVVARLEAVGCPADFVTGGGGGAPDAPSESDIVQVRCTRTLDEILEAAGVDDLNDATPDVLQGLASDLGLDGNIDWSADGVIELVAGVDLQGFYVLGVSGARLQVAGTGTVDGTGTVAGAPGTTIDGNATADLTAGVRMDRDVDRRLRTTDLEQLRAADLVRTLSGDATMDLAVVADGITFDWNATWTTTPDATGATTLTTTQRLAARIELPGFTTGAATPAPAVELTGVLEDRGGVVGWNVDGNLDAPDGLELDGFTVTRLLGSGFVTATAVDLAIEVGLVVGDGPDAATIEARLDVSPAGWTLTGTAAIEQLTVGPIRVTDVDIQVDASYTAPDDAGTLSPAVPSGTTTVIVRITAASGEILGPDGEPIATVTGISGTVRSTGRIRVDAATVDADVGDVLRIRLTDVVVQTPDADGVIVSTAVAEATATQLGDLTVTIEDLEIRSDGTFGARRAVVEQPEGIARSLGLAGLVPVDVTELELLFTDVDSDGRVRDLGEFEIAVVGTVDLSGWVDTGIEPVLQIGGDLITPSSPPEERTIAFSASVDSVDPLVVRPLDVGPIVLGIRNLEIGDVVLDAEVRADGFVDGVLQPALGGTASITGGFADVEGAITATLGGSFVDGPTGVEIDATATVGFSASTRNGASLEDLVARLGLRLGIDDGVPFLTAELTDVTLGVLEVPFGDVATVRVTDTALDLGASGDEVALVIAGDLTEEGSGASITFDSGIEALAGWGGRIGNVGVAADLGLVFQDGFFVDVTVPDGEKFGLPDFIPLRVDEIGLQLPTSIGPDDPLDDVLSELRFSFSGGLSGTEGFPITATVDDLVVDLGKLVAFDPLAPLDLDTFPIENISGVNFAIEPAIDLGVAKVSGGMAFGTVEVGGTDVFYARVGGLLSTPAFDAGADIVVSQYGPVLLRVTAPLGIPLGPTGFVLTSVTGAAAFGDVRIEPPRPGVPEDLLTELADLPTDVIVDADAIAAAVGSSVARGVPTWEAGFALALEGQLTHVKAAGLVRGQVTILTSLTPGRGAQLLGRGDIDVFGIPLGGATIGGSVATAGFLIDLEDPLAPKFDFAFVSPPPGSPLALVFPGRTTMAGQLRTDGVVAGLAVGLQTFIDVAGASTLDRIAQRLDGNRGDPLTQLALDLDGDSTLSDTERAQVVTGPFLQSRLTSLLGDPASAATVVGPFIAAVSTEVGSLSSEDAAALGAEFLDVVAEAGAAALSAADSTFNPSVTLRGSIQPLILGLPLGEPDQEYELLIDRKSLGFTFSYSLLATIKRTAPLGVGPLLDLATFGARDDLTVGVQLPLPGLSDVLLSGGSFPTLSMEDPNWSVTLSGAFTQFGMKAEVTGFMTSPGNNAFVDARVERRYLSDGATPPDPSRVQFTRQQDYDNLLRYGGLVLDGRLEVPRLLTDPVDVIDDLPPLPDDLAQLFGWFGDFESTINQVETPVRLTVFVPGLGEVFDGDATPEEWADAISVTGAFEGTRRTPDDPPVARLLSLPIGEGRLVATTAGLEVTADVPLLGAEGTFVLRVDERNGVRVPVGGVEIGLSSERLAATLTDLGLPDVFDASSVGAEAGFRAFTPGFDPTSTDPLERRGGIALRALVDADGFVDDAVLDVLVDPLGSGAGPDFVARASVDRLGPFAGVEVTDAGFSVEKSGLAVTVGVTGRATVVGSQWDVRGTLQPDLTGQLELLGSGGTSLPNIGGFAFVEGGLALSLTRTGGVLVGSVGLAGRVALPSWLAGRTTGSTATVAGCIATNGNAEFRLGLGQVRLDPAGLAVLRGTGAALPADPQAVCALPSNAAGTSTNDARLLVRTTGTTTTVAVDGAVSIADSGLPLLRASGSLSTAGTGSLSVSFGTAGLDLDGFDLRGGGTLSLLGPDQFSLTVDGRLTVPNLVTNAVVSGAITERGIERLAVSTAGLQIPGITVVSSTLELERVGSGYDLEAFVRAVVSGVRLTGTTATTIDVQGSVEPNGNFALAVTVDGLRIVGVELQNGSFSLERTGSTLRMRADASFVLWATTFDADGLLTVSSSGVSGNLTLGRPGGLAFGNFRIGGTMRIAFSVGATNSASISLQNGTMTIPGFGTMNATAALSTNGTGSISASTPNGLRLGGSNSRLFAVGSFALSFGGGAVNFAADDIGLEYRFNGAVVYRATIPSFSVSATSPLPYVRNITVPGIDASPFLSTQSARFRLEITSTSARFELRNDVTNNDPRASVFGGTTNMRLRSFLVTSGGTLQGRIDGSISLFGKPIASGDYNIGLSNGLVRLTIPSSRRANIDLGFFQVRVSGFVQSDGRFDMSGSGSTSGSIIGLVSWNGTATMRVRDVGISGSYSGNVSTLGLSAGSSGSIDETGQVRGTVRFDLNGDGSTGGYWSCLPVVGCTRIAESAAFSFNLSGASTGASVDTTRPSMTAPGPMTVTTTQTSGSIPVHYNPPTATDDRDGRLFPICNPGPGALFPVGQTRTVTCTATDAAGNTRTVSFSVTVNVGSAFATVVGNVATVTLGGFQSGSLAFATLRSEPRVLGEVVVGPDGSADFRFAIPTDVPAGPHTITVSGIAPDGSDLLWVIPVVVGENGTITELIVGGRNVAAEQPAVATPSSGALPQTGTSPALWLILAVALLGLGLLVRAGGRVRVPTARR
ncbi:MAG TPA: HYR domain-containing protein [Ilumatobacteraceae bacterium]|nr:HYR domain-containing protein [Ilumatobacteraceae bacterium]